jgi:hypothetical protein
MIWAGQMLLGAIIRQGLSQEMSAARLPESILSPELLIPSATPAAERASDGGP